MSESIDDERERIREQKKRELQRRLEGEAGVDDAGAAGSESPSEPIEVTGPDHLQSVVESHPVVLVDCYADWCGPCKMLEPIVESLAAETDAAVAKVDVDANPAIAQQLGARSIPTLVLYADGQPAQRMVGVQDRATLERVIEQHS